MTKLLNLIPLLCRLLLTETKCNMAIMTTLLINFMKIDKSKSMLLKHESIINNSKSTLLKHEHIVNKSKSTLLKHESIIKSKIQKSITTTLHVTFMNEKKMLRR